MQTTLICPISVGYHLELRIAITFYASYGFLLKIQNKLVCKEHDIIYLVKKIVLVKCYSHT